MATSLQLVEMQGSRKRSFDEVDAGGLRDGLQERCCVSVEFVDGLGQTLGGDAKVANASPPGSSNDLGGLKNTSIAVVVPNYDPSSSSATSNGPPPAKKPKAKLTPEEKAQKEAAIAAEKAKRAAEKDAKDAEKARKEAERAAEKAAKDAEKARKDAEKAVKDAEKSKKDAEKAVEKKQKEQAKKQREEDKQKKEEVKQKAERAQMRLGNFFTSTTTPKDESKKSKSLFPNHSRTSVSPAPSLSSNTDTAAISTPSKSKVSPYDTLFPEFFVHKDVTVAPMSRFNFDEEATEIISKKIDDFLAAETPSGQPSRFDARQIFHINRPAQRGRKFMLVREIMDELTGNSRFPIDLTTESQHSQLKRSKDLLATIPVKFLKFQEDVRPPYIGTYTSQPHHGMLSMARNPFRKDLPDQNYEYDSEAEWVEDDEDAEDLKSENDEEEELEDGDEMAEFLDDENDESLASRRLVAQGDLEHTSTGLCWEDKHKRSTNVKMMPYRMEIILDHKLKSIDPLSTSYWGEPKGMAPPPRVPLSNMTTNSKNPSLKSFFAPNSDDKPAAPSPTVGSDMSKPAKMVRDEDLSGFRDAIEGSPLTKVGLVDQLAKKFPGNTVKVVSDTLMYIAHRERKKGSVWELREMTA